LLGGTLGGALGGTNGGMLGGWLGWELCWSHGRALADNWCSCRGLLRLYSGNWKGGLGTRRLGHHWISTVPALPPLSNVKFGEHNHTTLHADLSFSSLFVHLGALEQEKSTSVLCRTLNFVLIRQQACRQHILTLGPARSIASCA
jgi:hypothetical protein